ncbi:coniferyl aldehyde dehydrogenase [Pseudomonas sp. WS 5059]|jgi:coniferyl-aldehyde dehydrogenase|uniref:coniferyl aldehyde dehydrogenase n=1 Tax=unclassified Pseudomonas TaxID=196821 RepID=UPI001475E0E6|nr:MULTISPECIES: coniferyl aldehyde dehydrogenase [unclassified Pseudomonas]NMX63646.1 coniferyl aldehyde dehydrogenase [Pseudomonas sp. WS 5079]NMX69084.1 coniferyl aldehyde dehydrogenase [Pseudomonas sp. WS 5111]NMX86929.1 coniferyl aldehyde dehydrogenase [Pseudomonas sp. WS 5010]NMY03499.1 coniferyl aldehyde dehydrogenase [Pseudomonas sp. WS 5059]NMY26771.1 coniferyl aldehyde dehydrogenase [Pseudomonas sp. WS 5021]
MSANVAYLQDSQALDQLQDLFAAQRRAYAANPMPTAAQRQQWLKALRDLLSDERQALIEAISSDFSHRSADETLFAELMPSLHGIHYASKHLKGWMKPSRRAVGIAFQPASAKVIYQPLGVIGVIVPWNYPLYLAIGPLVGALAAGNRVMLKLSESTPATGQLLKTLLAQIFPEDLVCVVLGEAEVGMAFSKLPFDHLLFTGATSIGKHVMRAAAEHLTPVTLELGGKSPAIVSADVPLKDAAERIAFGKALNAGQTCVAPDYVLVPEDRVDGFVEAYTQAVRGFYPTLADNPDYTAIINERQLARLNAYVKDATDKGATLVPLYDQGQARRMAHSLLLNVSDEMTVMQDEIFGPVLPIVPYRGIDQAFAYINQRPRPLALYYFGYNKAEQNRVLHETHSGGVCLNDTLLHVAQDDMPFGGIGPSGMGHYHGHEGFLTFSKAKGVLIKQRLNAAKLIYPPYGKAIQKLIQKLFVR